MVDVRVMRLYMKHLNSAGIYALNRGGFLFLSLYLKKTP